MYIYKYMQRIKIFIKFVIVLQVMFSPILHADEVDDECVERALQVLRSNDIDKQEIECNGEKKIIYRTENEVVPVNRDSAESDSPGRGDRECVQQKHTKMQEIEDAWYAGNYKKFLSLAIPLVESGDDEMQYRVAIAYLSQAPPDYANAAYWLRRAADDGHVAAKFELALLFLSGSGVELNQELGVSLLKEAAAAGHENAEKMLRDAQERGIWGL